MSSYFLLALESRAAWGLKGGCHAGKGGTRLAFCSKSSLWSTRTRHSGQPWFHVIPQACWTLSLLRSENKESNLHCFHFFSPWLYNHTNRDINNFFFYLILSFYRFHSCYLTFSYFHSKSEKLGFSLTFLMVMRGISDNLNLIFLVVRAPDSLRLFLQSNQNGDVWISLAISSFLDKAELDFAPID